MTQGIDGTILDWLIHRGDNPHPGGRDILYAMTLELGKHLIGRDRILDDLHGIVQGITDLSLVELELLSQGLGIHFMADHAKFKHVGKDIVQTFPPSFKRLRRRLLALLDERIIVVGPLDAAGDKGTFQQGQFLRGLVEIVTGSDTQAMAVAADVELVGVELENLLLGIVVLQAKGVEQLLEFGPVGAVFPFEQVLGGLLGQSRSALDDPSRLEILDGRSHDTDRIETEMAEKHIIFRRHQRIDEIDGDFLILHILPMRIVKKDAKLGLAVAVINGTLLTEDGLDVPGFNLTAWMQDDKVVDEIHAYTNSENRKETAKEENKEELSDHSGSSARKGQAENDKTNEPALAADSYYCCICRQLKV